MAIMCSKRRIILRRVQSLVSNLIEVNETAFRLGKTLEKTSEIDAADTVNKVLDAGGLATDLTGVADTISDNITGILAGAIDDDDGGTLDWAYLIES